MAAAASSAKAAYDSGATLTEDQRNIINSALNIDIPNGVDRNIPLPMSRRDPNYVHLKNIIDKQIILANQELDYHKIDMARNHLEIAAYYLKNVVD